MTIQSCLGGPHRVYTGFLQEPTVQLRCAVWERASAPVSVQAWVLVSVLLLVPVSVPASVGVGVGFDAAAGVCHLSPAGVGSGGDRVGRFRGSAPARWERKVALSLADCRV